MKIGRKLLSGLLVLALIVGGSGGVAAVDGAALDAALSDTARYVLQTVKRPQMGAVGGEWAVLGLARSGYAVPEGYFQAYCDQLARDTADRGGILHRQKNTEYARVILALSAVGRDARAVAGYDLTRPLGDFDRTAAQGLNGPVWALIALDSRDYPMPNNEQAATQATRQKYLDRILAAQLPDGGWSFAGKGGSDPDMTGMVLQALANDQKQDAVARATALALAQLSASQDSTGGFVSWNTTNLESTVQVLVALCALKIPLNDPRFVKNGKTVLDSLMTYYRAGAGFAHTVGGESDQMATEQGLYALAAAQRARDGKNSLYQMGDAPTLPETPQAEGTGVGLAGKDPAVRPVPITAPGTTFSDVGGAGAAAIQTLAARKIVSGTGAGRFHPAGSVTRAEFAAMVVAALGLEPAAGRGFDDVPADAWYASCVGTASDKGILSGTSAHIFSPGGHITRQEAAGMLAKAAKLCGLDPTMDSGAARDLLSQFPDYVSADGWARPALAFCYGENWLDQSDTHIRPKAELTRGEAAELLFHLLGSAKLL